MPNCGCFHEYNLTLVGPNDYHLRVEAEGTFDLKASLDRTGLANSIAVRRGFFQLGDLDLTGVKNGTRLREVLDNLKSTIFVDLNPEVEETYALGPYTVFEEEERSLRTSLGELLHRAKYQNNRTALVQLQQRLEHFIERHPTLSGSGAIVASPKSDPTTPNLAGTWAQGIAASRDWALLDATKFRPTVPQKDLSGEEGEADVAARVANSMRVDNLPAGIKVLILDDTIRSGGTIKELARALRQAGAGSVSGLAAAKDAKYTRGGIDLAKERWA
jgi:hypothetical protein